MPWWATIYLGVFFILGVLGIYVDLRLSRVSWAPLCGFLSTFGGTWFCSGYWYPSLIETLGGFAVPLFVLAVAAELEGMRLDLTEVTDPEDESRTPKGLILLVTIGLILPVYLIGGLALNRV